MCTGAALTYRTAIALRRFLLVTLLDFLPAFQRMLQNICDAFAQLQFLVSVVVLAKAGGAARMGYASTH